MTSYTPSGGQTIFPRINFLKTFSSRFDQRSTNGRIFLSGVAAGGPALDLNFASSLSLTDAVSGNNLITFSRASTGTYVDASGVIQTAAANAPRFDHDPATLQSLGLLIEEERTNLLTYSQDFTNSYWLGNSNVTANTDVAPDGNLTASTFSSSGSQLQSSFIPITSNTNYTSSIYIKKTTGRTYTAGLTLNYDGGTQYGILLNTNDGTTSLVTYDPPTVVVSSAGNFWRISLTANSGSSVNTRVTVYPNMSPATAVAPGQQVLWGAQLEANATFPTSYIPTTSAAVTRAADVASIEGTNFSSWYNQSEGTLVLKTDKLTSAAQYPVVISDGSSNNRHLINLSNSYQYQLKAGGATQAQIDAGQLSGFSASLAIAYKINDAAVALNGVSASDNEALMPTNCNNMEIFSFSGETSNGHVSRLYYYNTRKTDEELVTLTS